MLMGMPEGAVLGSREQEFKLSSKSCLSPEVRCPPTEQRRLRFGLAKFRDCSMPDQYSRSLNPVSVFGCHLVCLLPAHLYPTRPLSSGFVSGHVTWLPGLLSAEKTRSAGFAHWSRRRGC